MEDSFWLVNSNRSLVKRFSKNKQNKDKFFEYMFIDSGKIIGTFKEYNFDNRKNLKLKLLEQNGKS